MTSTVTALMNNGARSIRMYGSGVLNICWIGLGRIDGSYCGVVEEGFREWDYAASVLFVVEAGGIVGNWREGKGVGWCKEGGKTKGGMRAEIRAETRAETQAETRAETRFDLWGSSMLAARDSDVYERLRGVLMLAVS